MRHRTHLRSSENRRSEFQAQQKAQGEKTGGLEQRLGLSFEIKQSTAIVHSLENQGLR